MRVASILPALAAVSLAVVLQASSSQVSTGLDSKSQCSITSSAEFDRPASLNASSLEGSRWTFYPGSPRKPERQGWAIYEPLVARTIGTECPAGSAEFARALSSWQSTRQNPSNGKPLVADGIMGPNSAAALKAEWHLARHHVRRKQAKKSCRIVPREDMVRVDRAYEFRGYERYLRSDVYASYLQMYEAAAEDFPELQSSELLHIASAWRPSGRRANCDGTAIACDCSAHFAGVAIDINVGFLTHSPTDSTQVNREFQSKQAIYHWLLDNAHKYGFVNYTYEPWHWEWQENAEPIGQY